MTPQSVNGAELYAGIASILVMLEDIDFGIQEFVPLFLKQIRNLRFSRQRRMDDFFQRPGR